MKSFVYLIIFAITYFVAAVPPLCQDESGNWDICWPKCTEAERLYISSCKDFLPEATCFNPNPEVDTQRHRCDYIKCYCKSPKVRYFKNGTGPCVGEDECPCNPE